MENALSKNQIITLLTKSPHGELSQYVPMARQAAFEDPGFFGRLIAWNALRGTIRDAKVALPVIALTTDETAGDPELKANALAHLAKLDPRSLAKAVRFSAGLPIKGRRELHRIVERYLREIEASKPRFERTALQHRASLRELYALLHIQPATKDYIRSALGFKRPDKTTPEKSGVFKVLSELKGMSPVEIQAAISDLKIPFLIAKGAVGARAKEPEVLQALIEGMSPAELVTNAKALEKLGVNNIPAARAAMEAAIKRASSSKTLKTSKAAEAVGGKIGEQLKGLQEKQMSSMSVQGDWLVLADKSGSMAASIETAREVAATLARVAAGAVHLIYFDTGPTYFNCTGKSLEEIKAMTKRINASGGTSPGCALAYAREKHLTADGIVIVADCNENNAPTFSDAYASYCATIDKQLPVYAYQFAGDTPNMLDNAKRVGMDITVFDLRNAKVDHYALPNLIQTMRTNRYSLTDEINETPLLTLADAFKLA
jgi:hypothetical protein